MRRAERIFAAPAAEFVLSLISLKSGETYSSPSERAVEIVLCTEGEGAIKDTVMDDVTPLGKGTSVVIPASVKCYEIKGNVTLYKAGVPL
jgi:mannose-6-phosphate isomerase class I